VYADNNRANYYHFVAEHREDSQWHDEETWRPSCKDHQVSRRGGQVSSRSSYISTPFQKISISSMPNLASYLKGALHLTVQVLVYFCTWRVSINRDFVVSFGCVVINVYRPWHCYVNINMSHYNIIVCLLFSSNAEVALTSLAADILKATGYLPA